jgi:hypothetical protein
MRAGQHRTVALWDRAVPAAGRPGDRSHQQDPRLPASGKGLDTIDANLALGFAADERDYSVAAAMLRALEVHSVRLMTNNPDKVAQLERGGMPVSSRIPHVVGRGEDNRRYLETKRVRSGHLFDGDELMRRVA